MEPWGSLKGLRSESCPIHWEAGGTLSERQSAATKRRADASPGHSLTQNQPQTQGRFNQG